ncbi:3-oxoacid CoA-transferase subunit B [Allopusillimonas soli]|uniref:3-oxoacid CoA-transferase subunit B n=1 Tax=Allopusillimonas soli TaxID=659016 RepID=A0A853FIX5_9BURK|nr:3-oxoacid CoA-transferase subunit B [Allopusillimonas soli]NYT38371.1 3-oxoacid CoA-transferase subunit B [Allopusillimonas soli]TEA72064.1 3-oxoacid CoA-transferase subunit B [Allopusillimonas soli]
MTDSLVLNREQIAQLVAQDIAEGASVNLGIGMPTLVSDYLPKEKEFLLHSENGILGMGRTAQGDEIDPDLINASRVPVTLQTGASITEHTVSFAMMRGGHLDYSILGGFQVAPNGDLANWITDAPDAIPAIGGAMDLAVGARRVLVMLTHNTRDGEPKLVSSCSYPLTGVGVVTTVYTDLAIVDIVGGRFVTRAMVQGMRFDTLAERTGAPIAPAADMRTIVLDVEGRPGLA